MNELKELYEIHKACNFKDKDIAKAFERRCTPQNVKEIFRYAEALLSENKRLSDRVYQLEDAYLHKTRGCNP